MQVLCDLQVLFLIFNCQTPDFHQILTHKFYDAKGKEYEIRSWSSYNEDMEEGTEGIRYIIEEVPLANFHDKEVWLMPYYSHEWTAENPVVVVVQ